MRQDAVLVTGASGFLGSFLVEELLARGAQTVYVLGRGHDDAELSARLGRLWWERGPLRDALGKRVVPVAGDVSREHLGIAPARFSRLAADVRLVFHAAAEIGVNETAARFATANVDGTANALAFALEAQRHGGLRRFVHISTAYVAGTRHGEVLEDELSAPGFNSLYEQSKYGAEQLVRDCADTLPVSVVRPAQIVGDARTGFAATFNTLYYPLKLYLKGRLPVLPVDARMKLNMVPVDYVARLAVEAALNPQAAGKTFHAVIPADRQPTVGEMLDAVRAWSRENLDFDPGKATCVPLAGLADLGRRRNLARSDAAKAKGTVRNMLALAPYFSEECRYRTDNVEAILGVDYPDWRDYLPDLLRYATQKGFLNHTPRTVFEQMLVRMRSRTAGISYFDVSAEGIAQVPTEDVRMQVKQAAAALAAYGVGLGDRVALVGFNSTRYFIADAAVGLAGATSVPLYYTSPASDIRQLVEKSGAKLAFVGMSRLLPALEESLAVPIVSLIDAPEAPEAPAPHAPAPAPDAPAPAPGAPHAPALARAVSWQAFLAAGSRDAVLPQASLGDIATIRYTSGTTGQPKGVMFDHAQLRWMAQAMPSLLDWRTRNGKLRYLSFLPMSHVVEGILVAYAPYYLLSDVEMYFLNDFGMLERALPQVRPTLFFSVPRFYEKLWGEFEATAAGKRYLAMPEGSAKRAFAQVARRVLLRRAGLDQCRQLLVGSAPVSMELLQAFRGLGIEIHNAYGVTEAPLVALSRLGRNELGSVGQLLPQTQAEISPDGEILVSGPQVTRGYDGMGSPLDARGMFATGDFGSWSAAGNLVIGGRKKELIVTSYGKNISPEKVETLLKGIPGVSEALLVGEGRPYVAALLWLEADAHESFDAAVLDAAVLARNGQLSHPEQVKRWTVMEGSLSVAAGELTPNLKLRRAAVAQANAAAVEALYGGAAVPGAIHVGAQA